jgi:hypothetical protein
MFSQKPGAQAMNKKVTKGLKVVKDLFFVDPTTEAATSLPPVTPFNPVPTPPSTSPPSNPYDGHATARLEPPNAAPAPAPPLAKRPETIEEIYQLEKLQQPSYTAEKMLGMLGTLSGMPTIEAKRMAVSGFLDVLKTTSNVTPQSIAQDAHRKSQLLQNYAKNLAAQTEAFVTAKQQEIAKLEQRVTEARQAIEQEQARHIKTKELCLAHAERLDQVIAFLDQDVSN